MSSPDNRRIGSYEILGPLGAGAMGEVYRATDTRLKRQVAIKLLPAALAADPERLARFQREAEVLASLNHPHIAAIYGLEETVPPAGSQDPAVKALVMELVEGATLADRIAQGPMPIDEALPIARQIAAALEAAHEQGIVHRDLKPANIKVRDDGTVKVLDFGLAKLTESATARSGGADPASSPTLTGVTAMPHHRQGSGAARTEMGMILGTAAYMSPEQARGRAVDKRTDIWAFGVVLYEMLTGARAFAGDDITDVIAEVVKSTPDWTKVPAGVSPNVVTLIQRCLEKDRNARIGDIAVARFLLSDHAAIAASPVAASPVVPAAAPRRRQLIPWVLAALLVGAVLGWLLPRRAAIAPPLTHLQMDVAPADRLFGAIASVRPARTSLALSPDGRTAVFAGLRGDAAQLFARALDRADATPIPGTEGASGPFFSPDGAWIGFWVGSTIKKVPAAGGPPTVVEQVSIRTGTGASWGDDGSIYFENAGIFKVSSAGGKPVAVTTRDAATRERHLLPHALPGSKAILHTSVVTSWENANIVLHSLETGEQRVLVRNGSDARLVGGDHLVFMRSGSLMAVPFDARSQQIRGEPVALVENVMHGVNASNTGDETGAGQFAVSASGTLLYVTGGINKLLESSLVWVDRKGVEQPVPGAALRSFLFPRLSPDGQKIVVAVRDGTDRGADLWLHDVARGTPTRLTFDGGGGPVWTPDGKRVVFNTAPPGGVANLHVIDAGGAGKPERLASSEVSQQPASSGGNMIVFLQRPTRETTGIWVLPLDGDRKPRLFIESRFSLMHPAMSPDGRLIAYVSDESGGPEVYVQPYPGPGEKVRVSTAGGNEPIWTSNGRELLYRSFTRETRPFLSVIIRSVSPFQADAPRLLFEAKPGEYDSTSPIRSWDVSADGQRLLLARYGPSSDKAATTMHVVLNWVDELKRLVR